MKLTFIQKKNYDFRGQRVMLDFDLSELYQVETKRLNQHVKRNIDRFPEEFIFRLTNIEWDGMRSQIVTSSQKKRKLNDIPYAAETKCRRIMVQTIHRDEIKDAMR